MLLEKATDEAADEAHKTLPVQQRFSLGNPAFESADGAGCTTYPATDLGGLHDC